MDQNTVIEDGTFGDLILLEYCGSDIVSQFFDSQNSVLLTEERMGQLSVQNVAEFMAFTLIGVIIQTVFAMYFKSIKQRYCDSYGTSESNPKKSNNCRNVSQISFVIACCVLSICVMGHCIIAMYYYYKFVNGVVKFDKSLIKELTDLYEDDFRLVDSKVCESEGIGQLVCPSLFDEFDDPGYTPENAQAVCSWIFWLLIPSNISIFQYSILTSFLLMDCALYFIIVLVTALLPTLLCDSCACFTCWCCCCWEIHKSTWCPAAHCCGNVCCRYCGYKCCSCWCMCGIFGPLLWFIDIIFTLILIGILCFGLWVICFIIGALFGISSVIITAILVLPIVACHPTTFCCHTSGSLTAVALGETHRFSVEGEVELKVKTTSTSFWTPGKTNYKTFLIAMFSPLFLIIIIALIEILISIFVLYYVVDGRLYWSWEYFKPVFMGLFKWSKVIGTTVSDSTALYDYIANLISLSLSWNSLITINPKFDQFKYSILLLRTIIHIIFGIIDIITAKPKPITKSDPTSKIEMAYVSRHPTVSEPHKVYNPSEEVELVGRDDSHVCENWKNAVRISKFLFESLDVTLFDVQGDLCYCETCHDKRGDDLIYTRGDPPKTYALPIGWMRFGLKTENNEVWEEWHVGYHGTKKDTIPKIFDSKLKLLKPGDRTADGNSVNIQDGHIKQPFQRYNEYIKEEELFDPIQIYCSPSILYAGCQVYAKEFEIVDADNNVHSVQVAFQLRIKPGSYAIGQETILKAIDAWKVIDEHFSNNELEWYTKQNEDIVLTGLLFRVQS